MSAGLLELAEPAARSGVHDGRCGDDCGCTTALAAAGTAYRFPPDPAAGDPGLSCDLVADGGDVHDRIGGWRQVLARVGSRAS